MLNKHYSTISESTARAAKNAYSWSDYAEGSATASYRAEVDRCFEIAEEAARKRPNEEERIQRLFDRFVSALAENINADNRNTASCPSIMIAGGSNFPVAKKQKQNARADKLMHEYNYIMSIPDKIAAIGRNTAIYSDDENAIEQLEQKAEKCRQMLESMKAQNAYYRKHGTMKGYGDFTDEYAAEFDIAINARYSDDRKPFRDWELTSVREKMKAAQKRADSLKAAKATPASEQVFDGFRIVNNIETMRIQFFFDEKPDREIIAALKENGFRWAHSIGAWQRQLTDNGQRAADKIKSLLVKE